MEFIYRDVKIFYKLKNRKKYVTNIYLHGWGQNWKSLEFCDDYLRNENSLFVDFPPFGESGKDIKDWSIFTYANMIVRLIEKLNLENVNLIGHSFGGRVSIIVSSILKNRVNKLVLVDSAGMKPRRNLKYRFDVFRYKLRKKLGKNISNFGSDDYKNLNSDAKKVFVNIVNTNLESFLPMIKCRTIILFGEKDNVTPIYMAKRLNKGIKNSKLCLIRNAGHFCFVDKRFEFVNLLKEFVEGD